MAVPRKSFGADEVLCCVCGEGLPAFEAYPQKFYACEKDSCQAEYRKRWTFPRKTKDIREGEVQCEGPDCSETIPAGRYLLRKKRFFHNTTCAKRFYESCHVVGTCLCCGSDINDIPCHSKRKFCSIEHRKNYYAGQLFTAKAGEFSDVLREYLEGTARINYRPGTWNSAQTNLLHFLAFIGTQGITDLSQVKPKTITAFIRHERERGIKTRNYVGHISSFFRWLQAEERAEHNPVIARLHKMPSSGCAPRPLTDEALRRNWMLLEKDDSTLLKLAHAIGAECGLRIGEACNIRLEDADLAGQKFFVRQPTKNRRSRQVPFGDKTARYLGQWLTERDPGCPTDHLLHNRLLRPYSSTTLNKLFQSHLAKQNGEPVPFSFHALRHTWASRLINAGIEPAVLMELGGWQSWEAMKHYVKVRQSTIDRSYQTALQTMREQDQVPVQRVYSLREFAEMEPKDVTPAA